MFKPAIQIIASAVLACCAATANATVIDFNQLAGSGAPNGQTSGWGYTMFYNTSFSLNDYTFTSNANYQYWIGTQFTSSDSSYQPYNGTDYLLGYDVTITSANNKPFSLNSMDLSSWDGWRVQYYGPEPFQLIGTHANGAQSVSTVNITNANQLTGNGNDFLHFAAGADFSNLTSLRILGSGSYFALDNLNIGASNSVPEPGSLALLGLGMAGLAAMRRRKQR